VCSWREGERARQCGIKGWCSLLADGIWVLIVILLYFFIVVNFLLIFFEVKKYWQEKNGVGK
jgi:hypothetical protein